MASDRREDTPISQPAVLESGYRSGRLYEGREAILKDLRRYLELPFPTFIESTFRSPSAAKCSEMRQKLVNDGHLNILDGEVRWTLLTAPSGSNVHEDEAFEPFGNIIACIFHHIPNCRMSFVANPNKTPLSERKNTSRPDAYFQLGAATAQTHWFYIAASFEFKKASNSHAVNDNKMKVIWSLHNVMREDPLRRFAFGFTLEDTKMRLWYSNRAFLAASEPIDITTDIDEVISLFLSIGTKEEKELGWDPTTERISIPGGKPQYKFKVNDQFFTTTRPLATYGADCIVGRGVRVYEATDQNGNLVAIKDSWRVESREPEGKILQDILDDIRKVLGDEADEAEKYIVKIRTFGDVEDDKTLNPVAEGDLPWISITPDIMHQSSTTSSQKLQLSSVGQMPQSNTGPRIQAKVTYGPVSCRIHTRAVFEDVGETLKNVVDLVDNLECLSGAQKALSYLHQAGWVHRDLSINNILQIAKDGHYVGKLTDFEYAKRLDATASHEVWTGTLDFMAIEVDCQKYLFRPRKWKSDPNSKPPPFQMNPFHDLESLWWCTIWTLLYNTDSNTPAKDLDTQQIFLQQAFPGQSRLTYRHDFFWDPDVHEEVSKTLSETYGSKCKPIFGLVDNFIQAYETLEKDYPIIKSFDLPNDEHLMHMHTMFSNAYQQVIGDLSRGPTIEIQSVPRLIEAKLKAAEDEKKVAAARKMAPKDKKAAKGKQRAATDSAGSSKPAKKKSRRV